MLQTRQHRRRHPEAFQASNLPCATLSVTRPAAMPVQRATPTDRQQLCAEAVPRCEHTPGWDPGLPRNGAQSAPRLALKIGGVKQAPEDPHPRMPARMGAQGWPRPPRPAREHAIRKQIRPNHTPDTHRSPTHGQQPPQRLQAAHPRRRCTSPIHPASPAGPPLHTHASGAAHQARSWMHCPTACAHQQASARPAAAGGPGQGEHPQALQGVSARPPQPALARAPAARAGAAGQARAPARRSAAQSCPCARTPRPPCRTPCTSRAPSARSSPRAPRRRCASATSARPHAHVSNALFALCNRQETAAWRHASLNASDSQCNLIRRTSHVTCCIRRRGPC